MDSKYEALFTPWKIGNLGDEFLDCVKDGMTVTVKEDGSVVVD